MFQLDCSVQNYAWGKLGSDSLVAKFKSNASPEGFEIDADKTYAELWMGSHPSGPSTLKLNSQLGSVLFSDWLSAHPEALGESVLNRFGPGQLPYLFKVLSVQKALSIQVHPSKSHAEVLHRDFPKLYPDPNHKPEMAIALTPFEALCGFRPLSEIQQFLKDVPEFKEIVGEENAVDFLLLESLNASAVKETLRRLFTTLMTSTENQFRPLLANLAQRITEKSDSKIPIELQNLFSRIYSEFPGDIGCFGIFVFNYLKLKPTEAIFLAANEPHAYLYGDCVECMASSDNVVRAGLTPKHKDVDTLCSMLTYQMRNKEDNLFPGVQEDQATTIFKVPVPDFALAAIKINNEMADYSLLPRNSGSILLLTEGGGRLVTVASSDKCPPSESSPVNDEIEMLPGSVVFVAANQRVRFETSPTVEKDCVTLLFQAFSGL